MKIFLYMYNVFVRNYFFVLTGMLVSFVAIFLIFTMLLHIKDFYNYYVTVTAGFIPEIKARFDPAIDREEMEKLVGEIKENHPVGSVVYGHIKNFQNAGFEFGSELDSSKARSFKKNIAVIGFQYGAGKQIELFQGDDRFHAEVSGIDYFGDWIINIGKNQKLGKGPCFLETDGGKIDLEVVDFGKTYALQLRVPDNPEQLKRLYEFLVGFAQRFIELRNTGIPANRFEGRPGSDREIYDRRIYVKRKLLDCFKLIFSEQSPDINTMLSSPLYHTISRYNQSQSATLKADGISTRLRIVDFFNINSEKFYSKNVVLMNYADFSRLFDTGDRSNLLYIYGNNLSGESLAGRIKSRYPQATCTLRNKAIPTLTLQSKIFEYGIYAMSGLFFLVVCCIVMVRLLKFYSVFKYDLIFLKIYGYQGAIFSKLMLGVFIISAAAAYLIVHALAGRFNRILSEYYFPEISVDSLSLGIPLIICFCILLTAYVLERKEFKKLEYGNRGDIS